MKIHIIPTGYTPKVFTDTAGVIVREGADRIISLHEVYKNQKEKNKVEKTINGVEERFGVTVEQKFLESTDFVDTVQELIGLISKFDWEDKIFLHLGGGQRHLGLALIYASFFAKREVVLVVVIEYGFGNKRTFKFKELPPITPKLPTPAQKKILKTIITFGGGKLSEIISNMGGTFSKKAPSVLRHLRNLEEMNIIAYDSKTKVYSPTAIAKLFI